MSTFDTRDRVNVVPTDEEAISAEFIARINAFGGHDAYCAAFGIDRRNFYKYMKGRVPDLKSLLIHLRNLGVPWEEFFHAVDERTKRPQP